MLVPNFHSLAVRLLGKKYRYILSQRVNYFTRSALRRLVDADPSLRIIYSGSMHFNPLVIWQDWRQRGKAVPDADRAKFLKRTTGYKQNPALKPMKLVLAGTEAVLKRLYLADNLVLVLQKIAAWTLNSIRRLALSLDSVSPHQQQLRRGSSLQY